MRIITIRVTHPVVGLQLNMVVKSPISAVINSIKANQVRVQTLRLRGLHCPQVESSDFVFFKPLHDEVIRFSAVCRWLNFSGSGKCYSR